MTPGEKIKAARERKEWSQADLGRRVGISQVAIKKIEAGDTERSKFLPRIALELDLDMAELDKGLRMSPDNSGMLQEHQLFSKEERNFAIYASAEGGEGQIILSTDPIDFMPRPAPVQFVRTAYGLLITGTSMFPEYKPGEIAIVNPILPIVNDETYIFYRERDGEARASIKSLRRQTNELWHVRQWNPPPGTKADFTLSKTDWRTVHRCVGKYSRM